jgi:hypothetical protein
VRRLDLRRYAHVSLTASHISLTASHMSLAVSHNALSQNAQILQYEAEDVFWAQWQNSQGKERTLDHLVEFLNRSALEAEEPECEPRNRTETV